MKKFFTLIAAALMAVSVNAKTAIEWSYGETPASWNKTATFSGTSVSFTTAWDGAGIWLDGKATFTDYEYLVVKLNSVTGALKLFTQYDNCSKNDAEVSCNESSTVLGLPISQAIQQLCIQCTKDNSSIDIAEIYVGTKAEYEAELEASKPASTVLWEGSNDFGLDWSGELSFAIDAASFANASAGDKLQFTYTEDTTNAKWWQFKLCANSEGWPVITSNKADLNEYDCASMEKDATTYVVTLNAEDVETLKAVGLRVCGYALTCTKVELLSSNGISSISADDANVVKSEYFNVAGQKINGSSKGLTIVKQTLSNGKTVSKKVVLK